MAFHDLIAPFLLALNSTLFSGHATLYPSVEGHLGCFQVSVILITAAVNLYVQVSMCGCKFSTHLHNTKSVGLYVMEGLVL